LFKSVYSDCLNMQPVLYISNISDNDAAAIKREIERLQMYLSFLDYYIIVIDSCKELFVDCESNGPNSPNNFIKVNRLFFNILSSYYGWQEFSQKNGLNKNQKDIVAQIKNSGVLELTNRIRNRMTHYGIFVIEKIRFDVLAERNYFLIDIDSIFLQKERDSFNKKVKNYINDHTISGVHPKNEVVEIDAVVLIKDFLQAFGEINQKIWKGFDGEFNKIISALSQYTPSCLPNMYNTTLINDVTEERIRIGRMLELTAQKIEYIDNLHLEFSKKLIMKSP